MKAPDGKSKLVAAELRDEEYRIFYDFAEANGISTATGAIRLLVQKLKEQPK